MSLGVKQLQTYSMEFVQLKLQEFWQLHILTPARQFIFPLAFDSVRVTLGGACEVRRAVEENTSLPQAGEVDRLLLALCWAETKLSFSFFFLISSILEPPVIEKCFVLIMQEIAQLC